MGLWRYGHALASPLPLHRRVCYHRPMGDRIAGLHSGAIWTGPHSDESLPGDLEATATGSIADPAPGGETGWSTSSKLRALIEAVRELSPAEQLNLISVVS